MLRIQFRSCLPASQRPNSLPPFKRAAVGLPVSPRSKMHCNPLKVSVCTVYVLVVAQGGRERGRQRRRESIILVLVLVLVKFL